MKKHYDFSKGKRGAAVRPPARKTRVTIFLDNAVLEHFRALSARDGKGYQTLINESLRSLVDHAPVGAGNQPLRKELDRQVAKSTALLAVSKRQLDASLRKVVREELAAQDGTRH